MSWLGSRRVGRSLLPRLCHSRSIWLASQGTHVNPYSTSTTFRLGNLSNTPRQTMLQRLELAAWLNVTWRSRNVLGTPPADDGPARKGDSDSLGCTTVGGCASAAS